MMKRTSVTSVVAWLILVVCVSAASAGGGGMSGGALESTQLANKAQLIKQVAEAVEQTQQLINQYQNMLQNTLQLPEDIWNDVSGTLSQLQNLMKSAESLSMGAAFDFEKFKTQHPGYRDVGDGIKDNVEYDEVYESRVDNWQKYAQKVLEANNVAVQDINDEQEVIQKLQEASNNSVGQMQALQAGNQIATFMAQELTKMRFDLNRQIELQNEVAMNEQQERVDHQTAIKQAIGTYVEPSDGKSH